MTEQTLQRQIDSLERMINQLQRNEAKQPLRIGGGDSSLVFSGTTGRVPTPIVETLPDIPTTSGTHSVIWTSEGAGTGDDQVWITFAGLTKWFPTMKTTDKSGVPV